MLMVLGASHRDLELSVLDRISTRSAALASRLARMAADPADPVAGAVVLATCNRLEIYLDSGRFHDAIDAVTALVADEARMTATEVGAVLKVRVGAPVAAHLLTVASGLDSMVVGEAEISGQVRKALSQAQTAGATTPALHALFRLAAQTAKRVVTETDLGAAGRSVASVALDIAVGELPAGPARALIVGTGAYARVVATALRTRGCTELSVHSPGGREAAFAATHRAAPVDRAGLVKALATVDLVVACSGTGGRALELPAVSEAVHLRSSPLWILDLALHSDLGTGVRELPGVHVVDLHTVAGHAGPGHAEAVTAAQDIVIEAVAGFERDQAARTLDPAVVALRQHVTTAVTKEMDRFRSRHTDLPDGVTRDVELAMHRVTQALLHTPTLRAKELAVTGADQDYVQALHTLFGIQLAQG